MSLISTIGRLRKDDPTPLYLQLQKRLREAISSESMEAEAAIPTERDLAAEFDVSRITVRKAIDGLVSEGLLTRRRGAGTFVTGARVEKNFSKLTSFSEDMASRGREPSSKWVNKSTGTVTPEESLSLGLSPGSVVHRFHRIRYADGVAMAIEHSTIPGYCLRSATVVKDSLYAALTDAGHRPVRALQRLRAIALGADQAQALGMTPGEPALAIERRGFLDDGRPAEFTQSCYRGDAYDFVAELSAT